jgi:hypothetical protein
MVELPLIDRRCATANCPDMGRQINLYSRDSAGRNYGGRRSRCIDRHGLAWGYRRPRSPQLNCLYPCEDVFDMTGVD